MKQTRFLILFVLVAVALFALSACSSMVTLKEPPKEYEVPSIFVPVNLSADSVGIEVEGEGIPKLVTPNFTVYAIEKGVWDYTYYTYGEGVGGAAGMYEVKVSGDVSHDGTITITAKVKDGKPYAEDGK